MNRDEIINDRAVKLIGAPFLGIIIPNIAGLIDNSLYTTGELLLCYFYFISIAFVIWQGNVWLMYFIRKKYEWRYNLYYKIILSLFLANIFYSGILGGLLLYVWKNFSSETYA